MKRNNLHKIIEPTEHLELYLISNIITNNPNSIFEHSTDLTILVIDTIK